MSGKTIDADKLEGRLIDLINKYDGKNDREFGRMSAWTEVLNEMLDGHFDPDPIPLPTIKTHDDVRHAEYGKGWAKRIEGADAWVSFDKLDYDLLLPINQLELMIPNE